MLIHNQQAITYLQQFLTQNKACGMVAELAIESELDLGFSANKLLAGGWLLSPRVENFAEYRYVVFVLGQLNSTEDDLLHSITQLEQDRTWQTVATFLTAAGIGIIFSGSITQTENLQIETLHWHHFTYKNERLKPTEGDLPFSAWSGSRGRASKGGEWNSEVIERFQNANPQQLTGLVLRQAFFYSYLKQNLRKTIADPYDIDAFIVSYGGRVFPLEIKEKSRTPKGEFGIDVGRIVMLLRLCLATDSNALYVIREIEQSVERPFIGWRYITLADLIMSCSLNLQAGGAGMTGGATQTLMMRADYFKEFNEVQFTEEWLSQVGSLQNSVKQRAAQLADQLVNFSG